VAAFHHLLNILQYYFSWCLQTAKKNTCTYNDK